MEKKSPHEHGLIRIVAFILLFCVLLVSYSYLIRPTFLFTESLTGLEEEEAPIDVLFVGGSSTLVYWSPLFAFERYGLSSYNLSDSAMAPALMQGMLEKALSLCNPELLVLDLRAFENFENDPATYTEGYFRTYTDSLPYSLERLKTINYAGQFVQFEFTPLTHYFDFIYYHGEWRTIGKLNWTAGPSSLYKGQFIPNWDLASVVLNPYKEVTRRAQLSEDNITILTDLLDYIESKDLNVLCLLNAYAFEGEEERAIYNSIFDILSERDVPYVDTNMYYEEIGLDGRTDFYNVNHVNAVGAEKYTDWLARWLIENYELEDHRSDARFDFWWKEMPEFNEAFQKGKQHYLDQIGAKEVTEAE